MKRCHEISWQMWRERMQLMPGLMPLLFLSGLGTIPNRSQKIFVVNDGRGEHFFQMPQCDEFRKALEVPCPMWRLRPGSGRQAGHDWSWCHHEMILAEEGWCHVVPLNLPFLSRSFQILQKSLLGSMHRNIPQHTETVHLFKDISGIPKPS
jgi:hypothetical protein